LEKVLLDCQCISRDDMRLRRDAGAGDEGEEEEDDWDA